MLDEPTQDEYPPGQKLWLSDTALWSSKHNFSDAVQSCKDFKVIWMGLFRKGKSFFLKIFIVLFLRTTDHLVHVF